MNKNKIKYNLRKRKIARVRAIVKGNSEKPRLCVFFSLSHSYAQIIDDTKGTTIVSASDKELKKKGKSVEIATELGKLIAKKANEKKIETVVFYRRYKKYHGKVKALADAARAEGLKF